MQVNFNLSRVGKGLKWLFNLKRLTRIGVIVFCIAATGLIVQDALTPAPEPVIQVHPQCGFTYPPKVVETFMMSAPLINSCWEQRDRGAVWQWQFSERALIGGCVFPEDETEL